MINKLLKIKTIKVFLCFIENIIKAISTKLWKFIEHKVFNVYNFGESNIDYYKGLGDKLLKNLEEFDFDIKGKSLLELGPGGFLGVGAYLKDKGLKSYYVIDDINHFEKLDQKNISLYNNFSKEFVIDGYFNKNYVNILNYGKNGIETDNKFDIIFSNAVYEHVKEPKKSIIDLYNKTKKGGIGVHEIDFRDHIFDQKSNFFLKIPKWLFNILFWNSGGWVNRLRYSDFDKIFIDSGFEISKRKDLLENGVIYASIYIVKKI